MAHALTCSLSTRRAGNPARSRLSGGSTGWIACRRPGLAALHWARTHVLCSILQDLFTLPSERGRGVGRALIEAVYRQAAAAGSKRVYWHTQESNAPGRALYDKVAKNSGFIVYLKAL